MGEPALARIFINLVFAAHGHDALKLRVARELDAAEGAVALDDVNFAEGRVALVAVLQLIRHLAGLQPGLAADAVEDTAGDIHLDPDIGTA